MAIAGIAIYIASLVLAFRSAWVATRANPGVRAPVWRPNPEFRRPTASIWLQIGAFVVAAIAMVPLFLAWGIIVVFLYSSLLLPPFIQGVIHNRSRPAH
ncbi:MAG: hypothetical protein LH624_14745 [Cryobacterium sp.]|nr:hypothetical protein [Cryobacterium sp.]